jgi:myo-inositol-1(or 4)-monophosphatase
MPAISWQPPSGSLRISGPKSVAEMLAARTGLVMRHLPPVPALAHRVLYPLKDVVDLALARPGAHDWDLVASHCILTESGATITNLEGYAPVYALQAERHPALLAGGIDLMDRIRDALVAGTA